MKTLRRKVKKGTALVLTLVLSVSQLHLLPYKTMDVIAEENTHNRPSVTAFATKDELMNAFQADGLNEIIGKVTFGKDSNKNPLAWYILGKDTSVEGENIAVFAARSIVLEQTFEEHDRDMKVFDTSFGVYDRSPLEVAPNHYGASDLRVVLEGLATNTDYFSSKEQSLMQATTVTTNDVFNDTEYTTTDVLYVLKSDYKDDGIVLAGGKNDKILPMNKYWEIGDPFWLRTPNIYNDQVVLIAHPYEVVDYSSVEKCGAIRPATNLNLSSVLFASSAVSATYGKVDKGNIVENETMTLRFDGSNTEIGTVIYDSAQGILIAKKSVSATDIVSVVVQGNDGCRDWYYSKDVKEKLEIKASDLKAGLGLSSDVVLSDCKIWIETTVDDMKYAKMAKEGRITSEERSSLDAYWPTITTFMTKDELMYAQQLDEINTTKIILGKDSEKNPLEWYVIGKDEGVEGNNTALFATSTIAKDRLFEESYFGDEYGGVTVLVNHYGASDLRKAMQELAANTEYFTKTEQSIMQSTAVSTYDVCHEVEYTTTDVLYALKGEQGVDKILWAGSQNDKILPHDKYWNKGDNFWLRTPCLEWDAFSIPGLIGATNGRLFPAETNEKNGIRPATNLDLSSILFASVVTEAVSGMVTKGAIEGKAMILRLDGSNMEIGSVVCDTEQGILLAKKASAATEKVSLVIQGNDGFRDWSYCKEVKDKVAIKASVIKEELDLASDVLLSDCRVWVEKTTDGVCYANMATERSVASKELLGLEPNIPNVTTFSTRDNLMQFFEADESNKIMGKLVLGKDDEKNPLEWHILGRDNGVQGDNIAIFAANKIAVKKFEDNENENKRYETEFGIYSSNPSEVYPNHYGASDVRAALNELADNTDYFITGEQALMQPTEVRTADLLNKTEYRTSDVLYLLGCDSDVRKIMAGSQNDKILPLNKYFKGEYILWLRTPGPYFGETVYCPRWDYEGSLDYTRFARDIYPASNINLSSVVFASAAVVATSDIVSKGKITENPAMSLRLDGSNMEIGSVTYDSVQEILFAKKSQLATSGVSLVVQGNNGFSDWYYSKVITDEEIVKVSDIKDELGLLYDKGLSGCKIWMETSVDGMRYAVMGEVLEQGTSEEMTSELESSGEKESISKEEDKTTSKQEESTTEPESSGKEEESTTEPESSGKEEESTTEPESSGKEEESTTEPESSGKEEESTTESESTDKKEEIDNKPEVLKDKITKIELSANTYIYNGAAKKPSVTVKAGTRKLMVGTDYKVTYKNNRNPGTASVIVTGTGNYTGTITKTFHIILQKVAKLKQNTTYATSKITMTWNKVKGADGYAVYRASEKNGSYKYLKSVSANIVTNAGLKAGSKYYYKVRAYKTVNGKKIYGAYSDAKSMLTKPATPTGFTVALKSRTAKITWKKVSKAQGYEVYMTTSTYGSYKRIKNAGASTGSYNKTGLTKGKKYYFKMRAYTKTGTGAKVYSGYSKIKVVTVK